MYSHNINNVLRICLLFPYFMYLTILYMQQFYHYQHYLYVILDRNRKLPDDDVLTSKHVAASYIYFM